MDFWKIIEDLKWDGNYDRCKRELNSKYSEEEIDNLDCFVRNLMGDLYDRYKKDWLERIPASDDAWSDIRAEVVGRGKESFDNITVAKFISMAKNTDYNESFIYIFD
jgi:hypothetical protein